MISNNYVPEWHISPFGHSKYTLVRNQDQFDLLFDDMSDTQEFMHLGTGAQVDFTVVVSIALFSLVIVAKEH